MCDHFTLKMGEEDNGMSEYDEWCTPESLVPPEGLREKWLSLAGFPSDKDPFAPCLLSLMLFDVFHFLFHC